MSRSDSGEALTEFVLASLAGFATCEPAAISGTSNLLDLGLDSMALMAFVAGVESRFAVSLTNLQVLRVLQAGTVGDVMAVVETALSDSGAA